MGHEPAAPAGELAAARARIAELQAEIEQRASELAVINEIGNALARQLEFDAVVNLVGDRLTEILHATDLFIALVDESRTSISFPYIVQSGERRTGDSLRVGEGLTSRVLAAKKPFRFGTLAEQMQLGPAFGRGVDVHESWLGVPILVGDEAIGIVNVSSHRPNAYDESDERLVATIAASMGVALENARLFDQVQQRARTIQSQKEELSRFLSPQVAAIVSSAEGEQLLAGHRREITVAFCDLRGFTSFAEQADPEEVMALLSEYHTMIGEAITANDGTLEHFAGDGVMVFFNDPIPQPDHVERAVRMAAEMRDRFSGLAEAWGRRGYELGFGVGIAVGHATLGRIGFEGRHDYGAIGNVTILASRLSSQAGAGQILLSPRVRAVLGERAELEPVGKLTLKGISRPVEASNLIGLRPKAGDEG